MKRLISCTGLSLAVSAMALCGTAASAGSPDAPAAATNIADPDLLRWHRLTYDQRPPMPVPGKDYGMDGTTGLFRHPRATPLVREAPNFPGQLPHWDQKSYSRNVTLLGFTPFVPSPGHTWQNILDIDGRRYMYVYTRSGVGVFDITDPRTPTLLYKRGTSLENGRMTNSNPYGPSEGFGAANIQWDRKRKQHIMVQAFDLPRYNILDEKTLEPEGVQKLRRWPGLKGFRVYAMRGPLPQDWDLLAERTTDLAHPNAAYIEQEGSGALDVPLWHGGRYMFLAAAPDNAHALTEFPDYLHSAGYQVWDMSDPADPRFLSQFTVPGQKLAGPADEEAYLKNPRAGNRTSWFGSRMPPFMTKPVEKGGTIAFGAMAGLGLHILDVRDPANIRSVGHVTTAPRFAGTEFDNVDVSQFDRTGYVFTNGYPMNDECFEPYKDIFIVDARKPTDPRIVGTFPRPVPPAEAEFTDYCQRRGSFGPKRSGYLTQPGQWTQGIVPYAFYNAGVQFFDVKDPTKPTIAGYFVPRQPRDGEVPFSRGNLTYGIFVEHDRNIVWAFTNHGFYALSTPLLGEPLFSAPAKPWPPRD